jgi:hypothetical protein
MLKTRWRALLTASEHHVPFLNPTSWLLLSLAFAALCGGLGLFQAFSRPSRTILGGVPHIYERAA